MNQSEWQSAGNDDTALSTGTAGDVISIGISWLKSLLVLAFTGALALGSYFVAISNNVVAGWIGVGLFSLGVLVPVLNIVRNRPLLRFTEDGIDHKGGYLWLRGHLDWHEVTMIWLSPSDDWLAGRSELLLFARDVRPRQLKFLNWQLPASTRRRLRAVTIRFRAQIEENKIVVRGIE